MRHISIDIESFGRGPNAALASIGATAWDRSRPGRAPDTYYMTINDRTGDYDPATIRWHTKTANPVASTGADQEAVGLDQALSEFGTWMREHAADQEGEVFIWTHATFDIPIIAGAYYRLGKCPPWHYPNCRDLRTLYSFTPGGRPSSLQVIRTSQPLTAHRAIDDAIYQMGEVNACLDAIRDQGVPDFPVS